MRLETELLNRFSFIFEIGKIIKKMRLELLFCFLILIITKLFTCENDLEQNKKDKFFKIHLKNQ